MGTVQGGHRLSLCWGCKNTSRDKCSWFDPADPQPVPGWVAERHVRSRIGETYTVLECPNFDPEPPREAPPAPIPPEPVVHGVCRNGKGWAARITKKGKYYHLGSFETEEEAVAARRAAEEALARGEEPQLKRAPPREPKPKRVRPAGYCPGVYSRRGYWEARITYQGRVIYLGCFKDEEDAVAARKAAEKAIKRGKAPRPLNRR